MHEEYKVYDDNTSATATGTASLVGVQSGDDVSLGGSPVFTQVLDAFFAGQHCDETHRILSADLH